MQLQSFSIGAHSTWNWCPEFNFMIDCGEGAVTHLGINSVTPLKFIFLTHDHMDHVAGLINLLHLRTRVAGLEPIKVFYPHDSGRLHAFDRMLRYQRTSHELIALGPMDRVHIATDGGAPLVMQAFPVNHGKAWASGYKLIHERRKLRQEFHGKPGNELARLKLEDPYDDLCDPNPFHILTYTGDTQPIDPERLGRPKTLIHDATYPTAGMVEDHEHSTLDDARAAAAATGARLIVNHLSLRYRDFPPLVARDSTSSQPGFNFVPPINRVTTFEL